MLAALFPNVLIISFQTTLSLSLSHSLISFVIGVSYEDALQDGVILCKLMNIISPGSINKINPSGAGHFKICENLNKYETIRKQREELLFFIYYNFC